MIDDPCQAKSGDAAHPRGVGSWQKSRGLFLTALILLGGIGFGVTLDPQGEALKGLDPVTVRLGLGIPMHF